MLGLPEDTKIDEILDAYKSSDIATITASLKELINMGVKAEVVAEELILKIIENPLPEVLPLLDSLPDVKEPFAEAEIDENFEKNKRIYETEIQI